MVQDFFSVYSHNKDLYLLRIHHKVDFSDEIAWAKSWKGDAEHFMKHAVPLITQYLTEGFDVIQNWESMDEEGWHNSIQHLGFDKELVEMELVPDFLQAKPSLLTARICESLKAKPALLDSVVIPTFVGELSQALRNHGCAANAPKVPLATMDVKLKEIFAARFEATVENLNNYSDDF